MLTFLPETNAAKAEEYALSKTFSVPAKFFAKYMFFCIPAVMQGPVPCVATTVNEAPLPDVLPTFVILALIAMYCPSAKTEKDITPTERNNFLKLLYIPLIIIRFNQRSIGLDMLNDLA